ncbi:cytochrome P460 family protein [Deferribacteraceae bacterium V6Fe1]|nr:cytochrome P460 family protein [Deferribacteraceae bacterium V6Fe1]
MGIGFSQDLPSPDAKSVWSYIKDVDYTKWELFPGTTYMYKGQSPHGAYLTSFINKPGSSSLSDSEFANGTIIVKENYMSDKKLAAITVMYKYKGYNQDAGDWFWGKYSPQGEVQASGKLPPCIGCHSAVKDSDWSFLKSNLKK